MRYDDLIDVGIDTFGGYVPSTLPNQLPTGASPLCQDNIFTMGGVRQRGGLLNYFPGSPIPNAANILGLKTYITPTLVNRLMAWDSLGNLYKENPEGTLNLLSARPEAAGSLYQSTTLFGREYIALGNAAENGGGVDIPHQYDDTNYDRVSQCGPGVAPSVQDALSGDTIVASPNGLFNNAAPYSGSQCITLTYSAVTNQITVTVANGTANFLATMDGDSVIITSATNTAFNGTWPVLYTVADGALPYQLFLTADLGDTSFTDSSGTGVINTQVVEVKVSHGVTVAVGGTVTIAVASGSPNAAYLGTWPIRIVTSSTVFWVYIGSIGAQANDGGGTVTAAGHIAAGVHGVSVCFITRQGLITQAAPPNQWTAAGNNAALVTGILTGPSNVIARLLLFTPVETPPLPPSIGTFYSTTTGSPLIAFSVMLINDNVTTQTVVDFTDAVLISSFQAQYLFTQIELGESSFVAGYNSRLIWLGERAKVENALNLTFDGGFVPSASFGGVNIPSGWLADPNYFPGGASASSVGRPADWGDAYYIIGGAGIRGKITQPMYQDYLGNPIIAQNTSYGVRVRCSSSSLAASTLYINMQSTIGGFTTPGLTVNSANLPISAGSTVFYEFSAPLVGPLATIPTDLQLQVYLVSSSGADNITVDSIEIYPIKAPYNFSTARFSHSFNPESYDGVTGQVQVRPTDGTQLHAGFPLRNNYFLAKDHYLCYVTDDGVNEPSNWPVNEISATVGICGPNAVDTNEEWAVFAERSGIYICWGSDPVKISQEIQEDASMTGKIVWNSVNQVYNYTIWVRIDKINKRILIGAPVNGATSPNAIFVLDYKWLNGAQDIADSPLVTYSAFTGKILAHGRGRSWTVWNITSPAMCFAERTDTGLASPFFGNGSANGKIYQQIDAPTQITDDGAEILFKYQTYFFPSSMEEQALQLGAHRKLFGYLKFRAIGSGNMGINVLTTNRTSVLRSYVLSTVPASDGARPIDMHSERFSLLFSSINSSTWFQLEKVIPCLKKDATIVVSGVSG